MKILSINFIFLLVAWMLPILSNEQHLTRSDLSEIVVGKNSGRLPELAIINGLPYQFSDSVAIDSVLDSHLSKHLISFGILKCDPAFFHHCSSDVVIVHFATRQSRKVKSRQLKLAKSRFQHDSADSGSVLLSDLNVPVLFIDGEKIPRAEAKLAIRGISKRHIWFVYNDFEPFGREVDSTDSTNGAVHIWSSLNP